MSLQWHFLIKAGNESCVDTANPVWEDYVHVTLPLPLYPRIQNDHRIPFLQSQEPTDIFAAALGWTSQQKHLPTLPAPKAQLKVMLPIALKKYWKLNGRRLEGEHTMHTPRRLCVWRSKPRTILHIPPHAHAAKSFSLRRLEVAGKCRESTCVVL